MTDNENNLIYDWCKFGLDYDSILDPEQAMPYWLQFPVHVFLVEMSSRCSSQAVTIQTCIDVLTGKYPANELTPESINGAYQLIIAANQRILNIQAIMFKYQQHNRKLTENQQA